MQDQQIRSPYVAAHFFWLSYAGSQGYFAVGQLYHLVLLRVHFKPEEERLGRKAVSLFE